jgi:glycosyltransferase involved in cell wall biosynthesis
MTIKIATLMSVYKGDNAQKFALAIDSILEQNLVDEIESRLYIAVDGPVSSDIESVLEQRRSSIYNKVHLLENRGLAAALNILISLLEDEQFVFRMDADDFSLPNRYQAQLQYLQENPSVDILGTDIVEIDEDRGGSRRVSYAIDHEHALRNLCWRVPVAHPTVCFRRRVIDVMTGYPIAGTNEDVALWFACAKAGFKFGNLHEPLLYFTVGTGFWQRRSTKKSISELKCYVLGIWRTERITWKYIFPMLRFLLRCAPSPVVRWIYASRFRQRINPS